MNKNLKTSLSGIISNPVFVLMLGICPIIVTSFSLESAITMGVATIIVLTLSSIIISLLRGLIPSKVSLFANLIIVATLVTVIEILLERFLTNYYLLIEDFVRLLAVNCILFSLIDYSKNRENNVLNCSIYSFSMGMGFLIVITILGLTRELLAKALNLSILNTVGGGFLILGLLCAIFNAIYNMITRRRAK